jgi:hypothetical protein
MIRRFAFLWFTCRDKNRPSGRAWARQLGVSHTWLQKLVREFSTDPSEMWGLQRSYGDPKLVDLRRAQEYTRHMRESAGICACCTGQGGRSSLSVASPKVLESR